MRKIRDHIKYYASMVASTTQDILMVSITAMSFVSIVVVFLYMCYYLFMCFDPIRVLTGAISLYTFINLNKAIRG